MQSVQEGVVDDVWQGSALWAQHLEGAGCLLRNTLHDGDELCQINSLFKSVSSKRF